MKFRYKLNSYLKEILLHLRVFFAAITAPWTGEITPVGRLYAKRIRNGEVEDLGLVSTKVVTDAAVAYIVDGLQSSGTDVSLFKYHGSGTGTTAEAAAQTALVTEVATRATGSQTEGASANIYRTVGTVNYTSTLAITEHGIFSASSGGTMLDRSVFSAINVINGDSIQFTYDLTVPSGS